MVSRGSRKAGARMIASHLSRARDLCGAASYAVTMAGSYPQDRAKAEHFVRAAEDALNEAINALFDARMSQPASFLPVAEAITQTDRRAA